MAVDFPASRYNHQHSELTIIVSRLSTLSRAKTPLGRQRAEQGGQVISDRKPRPDAGKFDFT
jgi:hypothetical protein